MDIIITGDIIFMKPYVLYNIISGIHIKSDFSLNDVTLPYLPGSQVRYSSFQCCKTVQESHLFSVTWIDLISVMTPCIQI